MKNEKLSKTVYPSIPLPKAISKDKIKDSNKINKNNISKDKNIKLKKDYSYNKIKKIPIKKIKNLNIEIEPQNGTENKYEQKIGFTEINLDIKSENKKTKKIMIKHKTSSNINNSFNAKTPTLFFKNKKTPKIKISNLKMPKIKNEKINKQNKSNDIIINEFIDNKINTDFPSKKLSFDLCDKKIIKEKIFLMENINYSSPLLLIKRNKNSKHLIKNKFMTQKLIKSHLNQKNKEYEKDSSFMLGQQNFFKIKKSYLIKKNNKNNKKDKFLYSSFLNKNKKSISKIKTKEKPITNLKKQNFSFYHSKLSSSNINYNTEKNLSLKEKILKIETEPIKEKEKENLTTIEENEKIKKKCFNFLHHYLQNTVSTKNKIVIKRPEEKILYHKNETEKNLRNNSKSSNKRKYSFINRNHNLLKSEKISKTKENIPNNAETQENSLNKILNTGKKKQSFHITNFSIRNKLSNSNTIKEFNGTIDDYLITKELGKGSYATVKLAVNKNNKNKYAIKIYSRESLIDPQKRSTVKNEINILKQLDNINIMKLYEVIDTSKYLYLIMEYINGISLLETIKHDKNHYFEEKRAIKIFSQVVKGILYCQNKNICHRDIKLENILLIKDDIVKIIDFGFAVKATKDSYQKLFCGTPSYMAPEIVNKEKYIAQYSDIWSLGVLFFAMLYGRFPFRAKKQEDLFEKINEGNVVFPDDIEVSQQVKNLLKKIFVVNPTQRLSLNEILNELT